MDDGRIESVLDDNVGLGKPGGDIAAGVVHMVGDIAGRAFVAGASAALGPVRGGQAQAPGRPTGQTSGAPSARASSRLTAAGSGS